MDDPDRAHTKATAATAATRETLEAIRLMAADLRLTSKVDGLERALRAFLDANGTERPRVALRVNGDEGWIPARLLDELYLSVREALRNALRHSRAGLVAADIDIAPDEIRMLVGDDGTGFDPAIAPYQGSGLTSMTERVAMVDGKVSITSTPGRGTQIEILVPLLGERE